VKHQSKISVLFHNLKKKFNEKNFISVVELILPKLSNG